MDIKRSFKRFKKNYIRESEVLDNEDFVDVDLEGTNKTGIDWTEQYYECGGDDNSWLDIAIDYCLKAGLDADSFDNQEQVEEFLAGVSYDEMVSVLGTPEEVANSEQQHNLSDEDYIDPETALETDDGYDTDFNESHKCRKGKSLITEATPIVNDEVLDTNTGDDIVYEIGIYYKKNGRQPDFTFYPDKTVRYTFDEMAEKFGSQCAEDIIMNNSHDTNNIYYTLENVEYANSDDIDESCCCGGKKKSKKGKKDKKSKFVPFWAKKKDKDLKEALKTLKNAGYSVINECGVDCELEDDATGFGIAFDDSDYYTEEGECEVCAICGKESCDGEYDEDGNFVCSDCAENSLEQPMEEIDPMDIYFRAGRADNIRDMNRFVR